MQLKAVLLAALLAITSTNLAAPGDGWTAPAGHQDRVDILRLCGDECPRLVAIPEDCTRLAWEWINDECEPADKAIALMKGLALHIEDCTDVAHADDPKLKADVCIVWDHWLQKGSPTPLPNYTPSYGNQSGWESRMPSAVEPNLYRSWDSTTA